MKTQLGYWDKGIKDIRASDAAPCVSVCEFGFLFIFVSLVRM